MAKKYDDDNVRNEPVEEVVAPVKDSTEKLATAIESMVAANQAKSLPMFGPAPTDEKGKKLDPHGVFVSREGKEYDFIIDKVYFNPRTWVKKGEDPLSGNSAETAHCYAICGHVNYKTKGIDNWKPVSGQLMHKDLRNNHKKSYVKLSPELEKKYTVTYTGDKVDKIEGVKY